MKQSKRTAGLSRHPVFEIAEQTPVFLLGSRVYSAGEGKVSTGEDFYKESDRVARVPVVELGDFESLDALLLERIQQDLERTGEAYAREVQRDLKISKKLEGDLDVPQLIFKYVFPYLRDEQYRGKVSELLDKGKGKKEDSPSEKPLESGLSREKQKANITLRLEQLADEIYKKIRSRIAEIGQEGRKKPENRSEREKKLDSLFDYQEPKPYPGNSLLGKASGGINVAIVEGAVYNLVLAEEKSPNRVVQVNGRQFSLEETTLDLEKRFQEELDKKIKVDALNRHLSREKIMELLITTQDAELLAIAGRKKYKGEGFGFVRSPGGNYYAYLKVPAFAIKSQFDGNYYLFDKSRVGVCVWKDRKRLSYDDKGGMVMIDDIHHPLTDSNKRFEKICLGNNNLPTRGIDIGEVIAKRLKKGRNIAIYGYTGDDRLHHCRILGECYDCGYGNHYQKNIISAQKAIALGVPIADGSREIE